MKNEAGSNEARAEELCLDCGLCCNGVIFARVQLQAEDKAVRLHALGLPVSKRASTRAQPPAGPHNSPALGCNLSAPAPSLVPVASLRGGYFPQPCAAWEGCRCRIYAERPQYCRQFECTLLKSLKAGRMQRHDALEIIKNARQRAEKVRRLLAESGDSDEHLALSIRFRRTSRRLEKSGLTEETAATFGELTLAVHDLNLLLSQAFYPG